MRSHTRYVKSPATWLFVQQLIQPYNKGKNQSSAFLVHCEENPVTDGFHRKGPAIQEAFSCHGLIHTNNDSINHSCIYLTHLRIEEILLQIVWIRMARLHTEQNKSRINFLNQSRVDTDLRQSVAHATSLQWYITFESGPCLNVRKLFALGREN